MADVIFIRILNLEVVQICLFPQSTISDCCKCQECSYEKWTIMYTDEGFYYIFHILLPISKESIVFESNFRNGDFDGFTRFEVP